MKVVHKSNMKVAHKKPFSQKVDDSLLAGDLVLVVAGVFIFLTLVALYFLK